MNMNKLFSEHNSNHELIQVFDIPMKYGTMYVVSGGGTHTYASTPAQLRDVLAGHDVAMPLPAAKGDDLTHELLREIRDAVSSSDDEGGDIE